MRFDDRLKTVLAQPAENPHDRAVRWRQLVELLARGAGGTGSPLVERALAEVRAESTAVDEKLKAATARAIARPQLPADLVAAFAADSISVAAPLLAAVELTPDQWRQVVEGASPAARRFIETLHPELVIDQPKPGGEEPRSAEAPPAEPEEPPGTIPSISELVARIERLRQGRRQPAEPERAIAKPTAAPADLPTIFRWECGATGEIAWVEGAPRGALIGRSIAQPGEGEAVDEKLRQAFATRAPFREASVLFAGAEVVAGEWKLSGLPAFEPSDGRFVGYRGVAARAGSGQQSAAEAGTEAGAQLDHDSLRELVHEIRTPLNAIIGFAEIIDSQYLGPADHSYRERAADIVAQARLLLLALEDLDVAAKLRSAGAQASGSTDLKELIERLSVELRANAAERRSALSFELGTQPIRCAIEQSLTERVVRRFCAAWVDASSEGEHLRLRLELGRDWVAAEADRPRAIRGISEQQLLDAESTAGGKDLAASGFSLRLVRGLARIAGGELVISSEMLTLRLPREKA